MSNFEGSVEVKAMLYSVEFNILCDFKNLSVPFETSLADTVVTNAAVDSLSWNTTCSVSDLMKKSGSKGLPGANMEITQRTRLEICIAMAYSPVR